MTSYDGTYTKSSWFTKEKVFDRSLASLFFPQVF